MNPQTQGAGEGVAVLGGINLDTFLRVRTLPQPGETVLGTGLLRALGGKAANQAIAAARAGVPVTLLGAIGDDAEGTQILRSLEQAGVRADKLMRIAQTPTGRATILVDDAGQNVIVVTAAANGVLGPEHVAGFEAAIARASVLVVQGEIPLAASSAGLAAAERHGVRSIVNLAPYGDLGAALRLADPLVVNEIEASQLLGRTISHAASPHVAELADRARSVVVTLGADGALLVGAEGAVQHLPAPRAPEVVDTTGAGDAFVGVLAAALARALPLAAAVARAVEAATASVGVLGAGEHYPSFDLGPGRGPREEAISR